MTASSIKLCRMHYCEFSELFGIRFQIGDKIGKILEYFYNHGQLWTTMDNHGHWTGSFDCKTLVAAILNHPSHLKPSTTVTVRLAFLSLSSGWRVYQIETVHSLYLYCDCVCARTLSSVGAFIRLKPSTVSLCLAFSKTL